MKTPRYHCPVCGIAFKTRDAREKHVKRKHPDEKLHEEDFLE